MGCGSLGISTFAIESIQGGIVAIVFLAVSFYLARACIPATTREHSFVVGSIFRGGAIVGGLLWPGFILAGATTFLWFLEWFVILVQNPPPLPPNLSDVKACSEFIGIASKPPNFDPFGVWFRILR